MSTGTSQLWGFMRQEDKKKLAKTGFATPRGGGKNAYQNHVSRANRVIVPFERLEDVDLELFEDGFVIRLLPEQCFSDPGTIDPKLGEKGIEVGPNAFVLYRTHGAYEHFPPLEGWAPRGLTGGETARRRGLSDTGEYVVRLSNPSVTEGLPQGIFAPEYATSAENLVSQAVLAWLIGKTRDQPYDSTSFDSLTSYLDGVDQQLINEERLSREAIVIDNEARCPLCLRPLLYGELHQMIDLSEATGLANAPIQIVGATRSTGVNLFHLRPLLYEKELHHKPRFVAWGHAICNTLLGQRPNISIEEMRDTGFQLFRDEGSAWGFSSIDESMLRSDDRGVWARLVERGLPDVPLTEVFGVEVEVEDEGEEED